MVYFLTFCFTTSHGVDHIAYGIVDNVIHQQRIVFPSHCSVLLHKMSSIPLYVIVSSPLIWVHAYEMHARTICNYFVGSCGPTHPS